MKFSIIFPCYNEAKNLTKLAAKLRQFPEKYNVEFILVENGSTDNSREIFAGINDKRVRKVFVDQNRGYGYGIKAGLTIARGNYVGWMHADLQYDSAELAKFFDYVLAVGGGNVFLKAQRYGRTKLDRCFSFWMGVFDTIVFGRKMKEVMSGVTIGPRSMFSKLERFPNDFSIDIYAYALAQKSHYRVVHLPVRLSARSGGESSWNRGLKTKLRMSRDLAEGSFMVKRELGRR